LQGLGLIRDPPCHEYVSVDVTSQLSRSSGGHSLRLAPLGPVDDLEIDDLAVIEGLEAVDRDLRPVDEDVVVPLNLDEAVALLRVEPLDGASPHTFPTCSASSPRADFSPPA